MDTIELQGMSTPEEAVGITGLDPIAALEAVDPPAQSLRIRLWLWVSSWRWRRWRRWRCDTFF